MIQACPFEMNGLHTQVALNILPLWSYEVLIGMDLLDSQKEKLDCYEKTIECEDSEGNTGVMQGIEKLVSMSQISSLKLHKFS
jgi:hypothetical protein